MLDCQFKCHFARAWESSWHAHRLLEAAGLEHNELSCINVNFTPAVHLQLPFAHKKNPQTCWPLRHLQGCHTLLQSGHSCLGAQVFEPLWPLVSLRKFPGVRDGLFGCLTWGREHISVVWGRDSAFFNGNNALGLAGLQDSSYLLTKYKEGHADFMQTTNNASRHLFW